MSEVEQERPQSSMRRDDELDDFDKELDNYIETEEKAKQDTKDEEKMEKGEKEARGTKKDDKPVSSDNEDSEVDDYNLTEDQKRALEELDNLKTEMGYPDEDPPVYDVKDRLKVLNADLANDPTPVEKLKDSKVGFKDNLVDLVAPPPDFSDDDEAKEGAAAKSSAKKDKDKDKGQVDEKSEVISDKKSKSQGGKDKVLIEIDGQFDFVDADDVRAKDLGHHMDKDKENEHKKERMQPAPPLKPRPATATSTPSRRNVRVSSAKQRPQSAQPLSGGSILDNFDYNSPYALSPREKKLMEERKKALEKQKQQDERRKKVENEEKDRENREAFEFWLKKKRDASRRTKINDEEDRRRADKEDRGDNESERSESEEAFQGWLKEKNSQWKKEKLLKRRQDQEMHDGYYIRSRDECDKAYKVWLRQKAIDTRKARQAERQKARLHRLAAKKARKSITLGNSIKESQSFRYVDYYGYRF